MKAGKWDKKNLKGVELLGKTLGVVGFVFEGRPNVFADATGVLRTGNTVVFRIGSDALGAKTKAALLIGVQSGTTVTAFGTLCVAV